MAGAYVVSAGFLDRGPEGHCRAISEVTVECIGSVSSQQLSVPHCSCSSPQNPVSDLSILENNASSYDTKTLGEARWKGIYQQDSSLEKRLQKLPERPLSRTFKPTFPKKAIKSYQAKVYLSPQYNLEQEEKISIMELLSGIDSVGRALENEKKESFSSLSRSLDLPCVYPRPHGIPEFQITHKGKAYQDWRGVIGPNPMKEYSQARKKSMKGKEMAQWAEEQQDWEAIEDLAVYKAMGIVQVYAAAAEQLASGDKHLDLQTQKKVKKNATHLEVFETSHGSRKDASSREVLQAVICIQRYVRGWLDHRAFKRVKIKSRSHGRSLPAVVRNYRKMIARIKHRAGVSDVSTPLRYFELEEWMDKKKFYEKMFSKREFDKKMDRNDLPAFLRDCGYLIPAVGIHRVFQLVCPTATDAIKSIKKHQAIEMAFTLFPPLGAKVKNIITVPLPWVHPIIDGRCGSKKLAPSRRKSKKTDFQVSAALVASSMRERKEKSVL
ncbi:IQ domain-containing protein M [Apus apus]|uniref:IQ domain-containing protein M n=1 Tax=Apus apus TaxID=8895 RepID=UPI0021F91892|nr:IQ domain-containing protein M [Apus apus]